MLRLPIDDLVPDIVQHARRSRAVVVTAQPGAGKTTRVPPALMADGPVILLQPRRVAARAIAGRIAEERGWTIGDEIGWQIRLERRFGARTRLLVVTEGILTSRLQRDPLLSAFRTVVIDEFHERSLHADVAIALAKQAWRARDDLRIVVMSATLDTHAVSSFFDGCPIVDVPGRTHAVDIGYAPGQDVAAAVVDLLGQPAVTGDVLCFLPGASEIRRTMDALRARSETGHIDLIPLHGSLDASAQDRALRPSSSHRRIVVATNIAETSLTVPRITAVVDSGLHKVVRYDAARAIDSLELERITADAAAQRAGRAGRIGAGVVRRLWDRRDRLRPHREPEIHRVDLSGALLDIIAWGGQPETIDWFEAPRRDALEAAAALLARLGAVERGRLTDLGRQMQRLPLHPRLARMLIAARGARGARGMARACALLSERHFLVPRHVATSCDLLSVLDHWQAAPPHVERIAADIERVASDVFRDEAARGSGAAPRFSEAAFRRALLAGYPDRVGQRRERHSPRVRLSTGAGAVVGASSGVADGEFILALDIDMSSRNRGPDAVIRIASIVDREWLRPTTTEVLHRIDEHSGAVKAVQVERYDALVLAERPIAPDPAVTARLLVDAWFRREPGAKDQRWLARLHFAGFVPDVPALVRAAAEGARTLDEVDLGRGIAAAVRRDLEHLAPETLRVPSGRTVPLEYAADGTVSASVKLQELFGLSETPRVGPRGVPVVLSLLAPNGRPVQVTRDLRSFWSRTYPQVRKELRGRYPKHPWPEDPWNAPPTARVKRVK